MKTQVISLPTDRDRSVKREHDAQKAFIDGQTRNYIKKIKFKVS